MFQVKHVFQEIDLGCDYLMYTGGSLSDNKSDEKEQNSKTCSTSTYQTSESHPMNNDASTMASMISIL